MCFNYGFDTVMTFVNLMCLPVLCLESYSAFLLYPLLLFFVCFFGF